jgi:hypothetical protein
MHCDETINIESSIIRLDELKAFFMKQREREEKLPKANPTYFEDIQTHMKPSWRETMAYWMLDVANTFEMTDDTIGAALYIFDRYFSVHQVTRSTEVQQISLIGLWIATSFYDFKPMTTPELMTLVEKHSSREEFSQPVLIDIQKKLLRFLNYNLGCPSASMFARDFIEVLNAFATVNDMPLDDGVFKRLHELVKNAIMKLITKAESIAFSNVSIGIAVVSVFWKMLFLDEDVFDAALSFLNLSKKDYESCYQWVDRAPSPVSVCDFASIDHSTPLMPQYFEHQPVQVFTHEQTQSPTRKRSRTKTSETTQTPKRKRPSIRKRKPNGLNLDNSSQPSDHDADELTQPSADNPSQPSGHDADEFAQPSADNPSQPSDHDADEFTQPSADEFTQP